MLSSSSSSAQTQTFSADSNIWDNTQTLTGYSADKTLKCVVDSTSAYVYVTTKENNFNDSYSLQVDGKTYVLHFDSTLPVAGMTQAVSVNAYDVANSYADIKNVGTAYVTNDNGIYTIKMDALFSTLGVSGNNGVTNVSNPNIGSGTVTAEDISLSTPFSNATSESSSDEVSNAVNQASTYSSDNAISDVFSQSSTDKTDTDTSLAENNNVSGNLNIKMDGDLDDWNDITKTDMAITNDGDNIKPSALVTDDKNAYFYVSMAPKLGANSSGTQADGYSNLQASGYELSVNGKTYEITLNNHASMTLQPGEKKAVSVDIYDKATGVDKVIEDGAYVVGITIDQVDGNGNHSKVNSIALECQIPFSDLDALPSDSTSDSTVTLANSNLWNGELKATGGSTGPVVLASTGFVIAAASVIKMTGLTGDKLKRKKHRERDK